MEYKYYVSLYLTYISRIGAEYEGISSCEIKTNLKCNKIKNIKKLEEILKEKILNENYKIEKILSFKILGIIELENDDETSEDECKINGRLV